MNTIQLPLYVVNDIVYRARYDKVEQGVVIRVERCRLDRQGNPYSTGKPDGDYVMHTARFNHDYEQQTYEWKFFKDIKNAYKKLCVDADNQITKLQRDINKWETIRNEANIAANKEW